MTLRLHGCTQHDRRVAVDVHDPVACGNSAAGTPKVAAGYRRVLDVVVKNEVGLTLS